MWWADLASRETKRNKNVGVSPRAGPRGRQTRPQPWTRRHEGGIKKRVRPETRVLTTEREQGLLLSRLTLCGQYVHTAAVPTGVLMYLLHT